MDRRPVGVFDSGLGGLTAVRQLRRLLPSENIIYFGDTSRVPYGGRSPEILLRYARQDVSFLRSFDIKAILVACGTVSTTCLPTLQAENDLPILGVVEPACRRAISVTHNGRVGLIATAASVRSGAYERCIRRLGGDMEVVAREYLLPVKESGIDTLILGCTHYPLLHDVVAEVMGPEVTLIDTGEEAAWELKRTLQARQLLSDSESGETTLFASDQPDDFGVMAGHFLQEKLTRPVLPVNIDRY